MRHKFGGNLLVTVVSSRPGCQVVGLFLVLPPMMLACMAVSLCPSALLVHVALVWPGLTRYPCVQQYPLGLGSVFGCLVAAPVAVCGGLPLFV